MFVYDEPPTTGLGHKQFIEVPCMLRSYPKLVVSFKSMTLELNLCYLSFRIVLQSGQRTLYLTFQEVQVQDNPFFPTLDVFAPEHHSQNAQKLLTFYVKLHLLVAFRVASIQPVMIDYLCRVILGFEYLIPELIVSINKVQASKGFFRVDHPIFTEGQGDITTTFFIDEFDDIFDEGLRFQEMNCK